MVILLFILQQNFTDVATGEVFGDLTNEITAMAALLAELQDLSNRLRNQYWLYQAVCGKGTLAFLNSSNIYVSVYFKINLFAGKQAYFVMFSDVCSSEVH